MQPPFQQIEGVTGAVAGYSNRTKPNPSYEELSFGTTGYLEAVQVTFDAEKISFEKLLDVFWTQIDPTDSEGQFADKGFQYKTAILYYDKEQKRVAEISKKHLDDSGKFKKPVATEIRPYNNFYPAEEYHQNYANKKPGEYEVYKTYSGRKAFIDKVWGTTEKVKVYSTPRCHNCHEIKEFLTAKHGDFEEIDLASNDAARAMIIEKTGHLGAPIVQIGNEFIIGYDPKKMESLLK